MSNQHSTVSEPEFERTSLICPPKPTRARSPRSFRSPRQRPSTRSARPSPPSSRSARSSSAPLRVSVAVVCSSPAAHHALSPSPPDPGACHPGEGGLCRSRSEARTDSRGQFRVTWEDDKVSSVRAAAAGPFFDPRPSIGSLPSQPWIPCPGERLLPIRPDRPLVLTLYLLSCTVQLGSRPVQGTISRGSAVEAVRGCSRGIAQGGLRLHPSVNLSILKFLGAHRLASS